MKKESDFLLYSHITEVAKLLKSVLNQILQAQATEQLAAEPYERTEERKESRNGTYPHQLTTRVGTITLRVPRIRGGNFSTELFARYQRSEQALILTLMECWSMACRLGRWHDHGRIVRNGVFEVHRVGSVQAT
jgi:transposase-like protein